MYIGYRMYIMYIMYRMYIMYIMYRMYRMYKMYRMYDYTLTRVGVLFLIRNSSHLRNSSNILNWLANVTNLSTFSSLMCLLGGYIVCGVIN